MIQVKEVRGGYGEKEVIHGVSFEVERGEFLGILGPNGSGKTTLLKMIAGILAPESGQVTLEWPSSSILPAKGTCAKIGGSSPEDRSSLFIYSGRNGPVWALSLSERVATICYKRRYRDCQQGDGPNRYCSI